MAKKGRNRSAAVAETILQCIKSLRSRGAEPTFNTILAQLRTRNILSNHSSLRSYLDLMIKSGMLKVRMERVKQPNIRPKQVFTLTGRGPFVEVGEKAMLFHGLNWILPSTSSVKTESDIEGLMRARLAEGKVYGSLEDTVTETLSRSKGTIGIYQALTFSAVLLATKKTDQGYLMRRSREKHVEKLIAALLHEVQYLLSSPKPEVEDIRALYEIRAHLTNRPRLEPAHKTVNFPLGVDEIVDIIGKQLGVK